MVLINRHRGRDVMWCPWRLLSMPVHARAPQRRNHHGRWHGPARGVGDTREVGRCVVVGDGEIDDLFDRNSTRTRTTLIV